MVKVIGIGLALQLGLGVALVAQQPAGIDTLFPAKPTGFVTDAAHLLDGPTTAAINARLDHLRSTTGAEVAVVTLPTIGEYDPADVAREIARKWGVGPNAPIGDRRRNAGVLMLVVPHTSAHSGQVRIEVGQGVEGAITDTRAGQIRDSMIPDLQRGQYGPALELGTAIISDIVARDLGLQDSSLVRPRAPPQSRNNGAGRIAIWVIVFIIWLVMISRRNRGGPGGRGGGGGLGSWIVPYMIGRSFGGSGFGGGGFGGGGGGFGGFGGGGGFSGGGAGGSF